MSNNGKIHYDRFALQQHRNRLTELLVEVDSELDSIADAEEADAIKRRSHEKALYFLIDGTSVALIQAVHDVPVDHAGLNGFSHPSLSMEILVEGPSKFLAKVASQEENQADEIIRCKPSEQNFQKLANELYKQEREYLKTHAGAEHMRLHPEAAIFLGMQQYHPKLRVLDVETAKEFERLILLVMSNCKEHPVAVREAGSPEGERWQYTVTGVNVMHSFTPFLTRLGLDAEDRLSLEQDITTAIMEELKQPDVVVDR